MITRICLFSICFVCTINAAEAIKEIPEMDEGIGVAQIFDYKMTPNEIEKNQNKIKFIWGATKPWRNIYNSYYIPYDRDPDKTHNEKWYKENHPDVIVYKCNRNEPADEFKYQWGTLTPIDISNKYYREYLYKNIILKVSNLGFDAIALDNISTLNGWGRCGIFRGGAWVQKFSGEEKDPYFHQEINQFLVWVKNKLSELNMKLAINLTYEDRDSEAYINTANIADIIVDETGFSRKCKPIFSGNQWERKFHIQEKLARSKSLIFIDQTCEYPELINKTNVSWSIANYLLLKMPKTYLAIVGEKNDYGGNSPASTFSSLDIGKPKANASKAKNGVAYTRPFTRGMVLLNPSPINGVTIVLNDNNIYHSYANGTRVKNKVYLSPMSSEILILDY